MPIARMRRGFIGAALASIAAAIFVALVWLAARDAPSAGRDPNLTPPMLVPTRAAQPTPTPALSIATPAAPSSS